jgi:glycine reductase
VAERYRPEDVVVLLGTPNAESTRLYALTVTEGDPSWAGALAGVGLGLPVYHITEEPVKRQVAPEAYEEHVALMEVVLEVESIAQAAQDVRVNVGQQAG